MVRTWLQDDLKWMYGQIRGFTQHPEPCHDLDYWHQFHQDQVWTLARCTAQSHTDIRFYNANSDMKYVWPTNRSYELLDEAGVSVTKTITHRQPRRVIDAWYVIQHLDHTEVGQYIHSRNTKEYTLSEDFKLEKRVQHVPIVFQRKHDLRGISKIQSSVQQRLRHNNGGRIYTAAFGSQKCQQGRGGGCFGYMA